MSTNEVAGRPAFWRAPAFIILCGCLIAIVSFGPRSSLGFFLTPLSQAHGWGRDVFALALAMQNLLWGLGQPFAGAIADRFGTVRVLCIGAILYAVGFAAMAYSTTPLGLQISAGFLVGFGMAGCSFNLVLAALGKLVPPSWRSMAFGAGTAAGSFGQFLFSPLAVGLIGSFGWQNALLIISSTVLLALPLSLVLATPRMESASLVPGVAGPQSLRNALREALGHRSYILLVLGFFTCGFQLQFITVHMPAYLADQGLSAEIGGWTIAVIGLFNIVGSLSSGYLGNRVPKRYLLAVIYFLRALAVFVFIMFPVTPFSALTFGASMGLLWLSTVPPTNALVAVMFGTRWFATLAGFVFFSHQVGGFLGVLLGGIVYEQTGSYDLVWYLSILFGLLSAVINLPIVEKPVARPEAAVPA